MGDKLLAGSQESHWMTNIVILKELFNMDN